jgi:Zn-dependent protease
VNSLAQIIQTFAVYILPVLFAITAHEAAHGLVAQKLGDNTAAMLGRVTLNPLKHIDPLGTIVIPVVLYTLTGFAFGYAKPVPVRFDRLKNPRRDMAWVAVAGPLCNLLQALLWGVLGAVFLALHVSGALGQFVHAMCVVGIMFNLMLFALNLFPLPPLDGGRVLVGLLPRNAAIAVSRVEPWGIWIVMALLLTGLLSKLWVDPLALTALSLLQTLLPPLRLLFT